MREVKGNSKVFGLNPWKNGVAFYRRIDKWGFGRCAAGSEDQELRPGHVTLRCLFTGRPGGYVTYAVESTSLNSGKQSGPERGHGSHQVIGACQAVRTMTGSREKSAKYEPSECVN